MEDITIKRGDTYNYNIVVKDSAGAAIDCTGWTIWFTVRSNFANTRIINDTDALISKELTGTASGIIALALSNIDTDISPGSHKYDIQIKNTTGIHSSDYGTFIVESDITRDR